MKTIIVKYLLSLGCLMAAATLTLSSCADAKIESFGSKPRVWFTQKISTLNGTVNVSNLVRSFMLTPGEETMDIPFQVKLVGPIAKHDRTYTAVIVDSLTTAIPTDYELSPMTIRANSVVDTLWVKIIKSPRLDTEQYKLTLHIVENNTFGPGYFNGLQVSLTYSNQAVKPDWWDTNMERSYFGPFSKEKFDAFYFYCQSIDIEDVGIVKNMNRSDLRKLLLRFKKYITEQGITEADGGEMVIPIY